jgi:hypothetical protein
MELYIKEMEVNFECRGYQRIGENITKGVPDMHEAIDVSNNRCFTKYIYRSICAHIEL